MECLLIKKKIYIDAGHNFNLFNTGATSNGMREQDITYEVAYLLGNLIDKYFSIRLSRPTLTTNLGHDNNSAINARWQQANDWGADYFLSIHVNDFKDGAATGAGTFIAATKQADRVFAQTINDTYAQTMGLHNRGVKLDTQAATGSLGVLRNTNMPAALIELAFINSNLQNPDIDILRYKRNQMASALAKGIFKYFDIVPRIVHDMPQFQPVVKSLANIIFSKLRFLFK